MASLPAHGRPGRPQVVVVGAGFGGLEVAKGLADAPVDVTVIDKQNHHLFQPLLYQVATAGLSPADIAAPIRSILKKSGNTRVLLDCVEGVDAANDRVLLRDGGALAYDWLVLATGARHGYADHAEWEAVAPGLKTIDDATRIRRRVLLALEHAEVETDKRRRDALLTFVVIGGGPAGVELAGAIAELSRRAVSMEFRHITPHCSRIVLAHAGDRLLQSFPPGLSDHARRSLERLGVEVKLGMRITDVREGAVMIGDARVEAETVIWAAGVVASPAGAWLGGACDRAGRVRVRDDLRPAGFDRVFVIGDTAACAKHGEAADGAILPGIASVAKQQGRHVAHAIRAVARGHAAPAFRWRDYGNLATIGRSRAVADFGRFTVSGLAAWVLWCTVHIYFLVGFRSRLAVGASWLWNYVTFQRGARLITGLG